MNDWRYVAAELERLQRILKRMKQQLEHNQEMLRTNLLPREQMVYFWTQQRSLIRHINKMRDEIKALRGGKDIFGGL
jgi:uncharacterized C2H2 Zn-finger protein